MQPAMTLEAYMKELEKILLLGGDNNGASNRHIYLNPEIEFILTFSKINEFSTDKNTNYIEVTLVTTAINININKLFYMTV